jgi:hypothetical protein
VIEVDATPVSRPGATIAIAQAALALTRAHLRRWAAAILARPAADMNDFRFALGAGAAELDPFCLAQRAL